MDTQNTVRSLLRSTINETPFEHCIVHKVFSDADYAKIHCHWPDFEAFDPLSDSNSGWYPERRQFRLTDDKLLSLNASQRDFWEELRTSFTSSAFLKAALTKFQGTVGPRLKNYRGSDIDLDLRIMEDQTQYTLGPHTDSNQKLLTLLIYVPNDRTLAKFGTSLYKPRNSRQRFNHSEHHARTDFELVSTVPFIPNSALVFARTDQSFHGVEPFIAPSMTRKLIIYNLYLRHKE